MRKKSRTNFSTEDLIDVGVYATRMVVSTTIDAIERDPANYLSSQKNTHTKKRALRVDLDAEDNFEEILHTYLNGRFASVSFYGEERLGSQKLDLSSETGIVALVDAIDGTDLLERGIGNWCCASLFFQPSAKKGNRIRAAFVGLPNRSVYYASDREEGVFVVRGRQDEAVRAAGPSDVKTLARASMYFYGQKVANFFGTAEQMETLRDCPKDFRIYTLGGIPMMARLVDRTTKNAGGVDAVVELMGQQPHDAIPGLYLARKGGAVALQLDGQEMPLSEMEAALMRPAAHRIKYVAASTSALARAVLAFVTPKSAQKAEAIRKN
jgi:fructose-1,6-bisphosphatase/inositol monophosphatase family enzyme